MRATILGSMTYAKKTSRILAWRAFALLLAGLSLLVSGFLGSSAAGAPPPFIVLEDGLLGRTVSAVAVDTERRRLYVGLAYVRDRRSRLLLVGSYGADGAVVGDWREVEIGPPNLDDRQHRTVARILLDPRYKRLFLAVNGAPAEAWPQTLGVLDLDADGWPEGEARFRATGNPHVNCADVSLHPTLPVLYAVGWGGSGVYVHALAETGDPTGEPQAVSVGGHGKMQVSVHPNGGVLYLGTYPDMIEQMAIGKTGRPRRRGTLSLGTEQVYRRFMFTPDALLADDVEGLLRIPLDAEGFIAGTVPERVSERDLDVLPRQGPRLLLPFKVWEPDRLYPEVRRFEDGTVWYTGDSAGGSALSLSDSPWLTWPGHRPVLVEQAADGTVVVVRQKLKAGLRGNRTAGWRLRVTALHIEKSPGEARDLDVSVNVDHLEPARTQRFGRVREGEPGEWHSLDDLLRDRVGVKLGGLRLTGARVGRMTLRLEFSHRPPAVSAVKVAPTMDLDAFSEGGDADGDEDAMFSLEDPDAAPVEVLRTFEVEVSGSSLALLFPAYGEADDEAFPRGITLFSEHAKRYFEAASKVAVPESDRPRRFLVNAGHLLGGQGHLPTLERNMEALAMLGFNCVSSYWNDEIPAAKVGELLDRYGFIYRTGAVYAPPSYMAYHRELMNPEALDKWAAKLVAGTIAKDAGSPENIHHFKLADEPGWYFPSRFREVIEDPVALQVFRDYLKERGGEASFFGASRWEDLFPIGVDKAVDLPSRRLFYWSITFYRDQANEGMRLGRDALRRATRPDLTCSVNWNNFVSAEYRASPNAKIGNNPDEVPDSAMGGFNWVQFGRQRSAMPFSEDWFGDAAANAWTWYADVLRSSAALGEGRFGGYTIGCCMGGHSAGAAYKIFSLLSRGAKMVDVYTFGPEFFFPGNCWSERLNIYPALADALGLLGRAEDMLYPALPARGQVAILLPDPSALWETDSRRPLYESDLAGLHRALTHAGYPVDALDDIDLETGDFAGRGYRLIYACGPNAARDGETRLAEWVRAGGTLVLSPGALTADRYNEPHDPFRAAAGTARAAVRDRDVRLVEYAEVPVWGLNGQRLEDRASPAELAPDSGIQTVVEMGKGRVVFRHVFAGAEYLRHLDTVGGLPRGYRPELRALVAGPARSARCARPVMIEGPLVEGSVLEADAGWAVVLLNWEGTPVPELDLLLPGIRSTPVSVVSARGVPVQAEVTAGGLRVRMALENVDVLMVHRGKFKNGVNP